MNIAALSWIERRAAAALFGEPPAATYEDALNYFMNAETISPGFYIMNQVRIAEVYINLNKKEEASKYLQSAQSNFTALGTKATFDDKEAYSASKKLMNKLA